MGCNCGAGGNRARTIAQRNREAQERSSGGSLLGFDADNPILVGETGDGEVWRVRVLSPVEGFSMGSAKFVTGKGVKAHIDSGAFHDITTTSQKKRLWRVGAATYTSEQVARRVGAATGQTPIEVA